MTQEDGLNKLYPLIEYIDSQEMINTDSISYTKIQLTKEDILRICNITEPENQTSRQRVTYSLAKYAGRIRKLVENFNCEYIVDVHSKWQRVRDNKIELIEYDPSKKVFIVLETRDFKEGDENIMVPKGGYITITKIYH